VPDSGAAQHVNAMRDYEKEINGLRDEMSIIKNELQDARRDREYLTSLIETLVNAHPPTLSTIATSSVPLTANAPIASTITSHFPSRLPPRFVPSSTKLPQSLLISLQNVTLSSAFHRWYNEELFKCTVVNEKEMKVRRKLAYAVSMMKRFLPDNTVISSKPESLPEFQEWSAHIQQLAEVAQERIIELCQKAYASDLVAGTRKRKRTVLKPMLEGMIKRVGAIYKHRSELFTSAIDLVDDRADTTSIAIPMENEAI
jgi:hypothetical protein